MATAAEQIVRKSWIEWAVDAYQKQQEEYEKYDDYYDGEQLLEYSTERWKEVFGEVFDGFADNWCQVVVDAADQRTEIIGWKCDDKSLVRKAENIWDASHVDLEAEDLHLQTYIKGDAYLIVWPSTEHDGVDLFFNDALDINVKYDPQNKRKLLRASKKWMTDRGDIRLNIYHPDRIEQFVVKNEDNYALQSGFMEPYDVLPEGWARYDDDIENPYGIVPVFHFKNRSRGTTHGKSELKTVIPIQNSINKTLMDTLLGAEFAGFPQKWMAGGGHPPEGWKAGQNRVWATTDPSAKFGQFDQADLDSLLHVVEGLVGHTAKTTQTPMYYLKSSGDMPSGEALKTAEAGLVHKVKKATKRWGHTWGHAMAFAIHIQENGDTPFHSYGEDQANKLASLYPIWKNPQSRYDLEQAQVAQLKSILGVPLEQLWSEHFDYTEEQIKNFKELNKAVAATALAQLVAQSGQVAPGAQGTFGELLGAPEGVDLAGMDIPQILALLSKGQTSKTTAGEATTKPQANTSPPASPTRRGTGFKS